MEKILFSILIPAYKTDFLYEAIDSILNQDYNNFEIIIIDDCSPNPVKEIVGRFANNDNRIKYFQNKKNAGAANLVDTWNKCLSLSTGDYIICMGDDDRLKPNCLSGYIRLINNNPGFDVYHGRTEIINENSKVTNLQEERPIYESVYSMMYNRWTGRIQFVGDFLYRRNSLERRGGFFNLPMAWGSDDITSYIVARERGIINSFEPLFQYRISSKTLTNSGNAELKLDAIIKDEQWTIDFLKEKPSNPNDFHYWEQLNALMVDHYATKKGAALYCDMMANGIFRFFYWIKNKKKYSLTYKLIARSYFISCTSHLANFQKCFLHGKNSKNIK